MIVKTTTLLLTGLFLATQALAVAPSKIPHASLPAHEKMTESDSLQIQKLIALYAQARENRDTVLLKSILTPDIDQLVSSGTWRRGLPAAIQGMMRSSARRPGSRGLRVERIRFLDKKHAIADARYEITNTDGSVRKMWSTFIVVREKKAWKISAIRNMLPAR